MSRIDEALRQATGQLLQEPPSQTAEPAVSGGAVEVSVLTRYAIEDPAGARQPLREPQRPIAVAPRAEATKLAPIAVPPALENRLVIGREIPPPTVEQYRRLAAVLHDLQAQHGLKVLMVTSAAPQEGKTLTAANVALTLSESYRQRVLLVDADLRRPSVHQVFGIPNGTGLADLVNGGRHAAAPTQISPCLSVLTAGRGLASPLAMLTSDRMRDVIVEAMAHYDWVLLDTPPVGLLPDAQLVSRLSEGALFVIAAGVTPYSAVQRAIADLGADRIVGTVLNRVDGRALGGDSYGGYYDTQHSSTGAR
jgi:capsular exopolysaccharide synthesis family protein